MMVVVMRVFTLPRPVDLCHQVWLMRRVMLPSSAAHHVHIRSPFEFAAEFHIRVRL
jgi:hypothetical protein